MSHLFSAEIKDWDSWSKIFHSIDAWEKLVKFIFEKEMLPFDDVENLQPGTNAVFKSGGYVVKIFTPAESGLDGKKDFETECFSLDFAESHGVFTPKLVSKGIVNDKYCFPYMIMDYISGRDFKQTVLGFSGAQKTAIAGKIREIVFSLNKPCENFNGVDVISGKPQNFRWDKFPQSFREERLEYLKTHSFGERVFVHGDLSYDNLIIDNSGKIYIIDFADAVIAPLSYEHGHLVSVLFGFDRDYLSGFFGNYSYLDLTDLCFDGLLIHDFGGDIIDSEIMEAAGIKSLNELRNIILRQFR